MEFLALAIWLLVAGTGAILLPHAVTTPGAGLAALAGLGGLTVCILYIVLGCEGAGPRDVGPVHLGLGR